MDVNGDTNAAAPKQWVVYDKNARGDVPRSHEIIVKTFEDGRDPLTKTVKLYADKAPEPPLSMAEAMKFLSDPSFIVQGPDGVRLTPPPKVEGGTGAFQLPENQTIANWDELTGSALFKRCQIIPGGGDRVKVDTPREQMVEFLLNWQRAQKKGVDGIAQVLNEQIAGASDLDGAADEPTLDKLFPKENPFLEKLRADNSASVS